MKPIYLDHNATSPLDPQVAQAMNDAYRAGYANPASQHQAGRQARKAIENARDNIAEIVGANASDRVIFTSGGTEANNLALRGLAGRSPGRVIISSIEHPSVAGTAEYLQQQGFQVCRLPTTPDGVVQAEQLGKLLDENTRLVSVMLGNHETGVLQPVHEIAAMCNEAGIPMHTDAVQVVGKLPVDFCSLGVSTMALSGHKLAGPRGIGALVVRGGTALEPILYGGFQQGGLRPGTESVVLAVGLHKALQLWQQQAPLRLARMTALRDRLETVLQTGWPDLVINGAAASRLPHTSNLAFVGLERQALFMALDQAGVACSTGSACASGSSDPSPVLLAMGCRDEVVQSSLRLSLGCCTSEAEIDEAARRILQVCTDLRDKKRPGNPAVPSRQRDEKTL